VTGEAARAAGERVAGEESSPPEVLVAEAAAERVARGEPAAWMEAAETAAGPVEAMAEGVTEEEDGMQPWGQAGAAEVESRRRGEMMGGTERREVLALAAGPGVSGALLEALEASAVI
jgi:hypothetical protein